MRAILAIGIVAIMTVLSACAPAPPAPFNSVAFERRPPLPGRPGYLETIKYIDDGVRYIAPNAGFVVSSTGEMCFQGSIVPGPTPVLVPQPYWCMSPLDVSMVEALQNGISYINRVRLWCQLASPQCAHKIAYPNDFDNAKVANSITAETIPFQRQREAIEYLVYLMGGSTGRDEALFQ
jgi:hypothetical protein